MPFKEYEKKRKFSYTPEPKGNIRPKKGQLTFVVQKHDASHLHYDLRLELNGVLKSWAIPKGPTIKPAGRRLAMMVEDHPYNYKDFEGIIPEGNYGAGTVMIWDKGQYHATSTADSTESENQLNEGLKKGHLSFVLEGEKLKGEFALVRMKNAREPNAWLLIKADDSGSSEEDILKKNKSVLSGKTIEEIEGQSEDFWNSRLGGIIISEAPKEKMPDRVRPMLTTFVDSPFNGKDWHFEIKWDGYRIIAFRDHDSFRLQSRNFKSLNQKFKEIVTDLQLFPHQIILDGEAVVLNQEGMPDFQLLQDYDKSHNGRLVFYVFDLLYLEGRTLERCPLSMRREVLEKIMPKCPYIKISEAIIEKGEGLFDAIKQKGLEGMIAKKLESPYRQGVRSGDWLKIKTHLEQEVVIGGYSAPAGSRMYLGSLIVGVYDQKKLIYVGSVGTGFGNMVLKELKKMLDKEIIKSSPFANISHIKGATWVNPKYVAEIKFQEWTRDNLLRQPVFLGLREDKDPGEVTKEIPSK
ncbi:MAG: non-homologous end-joining DNA ligase [Patescibacteria group bacterium]